MRAIEVKKYAENHKRLWDISRNNYIEYVLRPDKPFVFLSNATMAILMETKKDLHSKRVFVDNVLVYNFVVNTMKAIEHNSSSTGMKLDNEDITRALLLFPAGIRKVGEEVRNELFSIDNLRLTDKQINPADDCNACMLARYREPNFMGLELWEDEYNILLFEDLAYNLAVNSKYTGWVTYNYKLLRQNNGLVAYELAKYSKVNGFTTDCKEILDLCDGQVRSELAKNRGA